MATRLHQVLSFVAVPAAGVAVLPHALNWEGYARIPDRVFNDATNATNTVLAVTSSSMTVRNDSAAPATLTYWLELFHTFERAFGSSNTIALTPLPFVAGGGGAGGGGSVGALQSFRYTVSGLEPDASDFFVTLPAARATDIYRVTVGLAGTTDLPALDFPDLIVGDRTTTQFRVVSSIALPVGTQIDFHVFDQVP